MSWLLTQYGIELEINTTPGGAATWAAVCDGFDNISKAANEQVQEFFFLCGKGFGCSEVTGARPVLTLTGVRKIGDAAQDFIFSMKYRFLNGRKTQLRISIANGDGTVHRETLNVTVQNIQDFGGNSTDGAAISVEFAQNGPPTVETLTPTASVTVTSVAGANKGETVLSCAPSTPDSGCKFVYKYAPSTAPAAAAGAILSTWDDFTSGATYVIPNGDKVTIAMVSYASYACIASGNATVVSKTT